MTETTIAEARARSRRSVEAIFAALAAAALALSLCFHYDLFGLALPEGDQSLIARAFLVVAALDTGMMFVWERLLPRDR